MKNKTNKKLLSLILSMMLIVAMAFHMTACSDDNKTGATHSQKDGGIVGEGNTVFTFTVVDKEGNETVFEIHTDKTIVGDALLEANLLAGEQGAYGLYVKTVNGITADYNVDGTYWAFYINGEYASSGVDSTTIKEGDSYSFKVE